MFATRPITLVNGTVIGPEGRCYQSVRVRGGLVDALDRAPQRGDAVIDLEAAVVLPGLINAHDHLELNSFKRLKWRPRYTNVREWIADFQPRFMCDPDLADARPETLADRLWVGGLKNLLSGVTTVCHHNPLHRPLGGRFPVRVMRKFGFSHSLQVDGRTVARSYSNTPPRWPWVIHAAEGIDREAESEIDTLEALGCVRDNTVLVHGIGIDRARGTRVLQRGGALVWCPSSNAFLFGRTADVRRFDEASRVALGTDSRLSGEGDLLDELRVALNARQLSAERLVRSVTASAAAMFRLRDAGRLECGQPADLVVMRRREADPYASVIASRRIDVQLTMIGGTPLIGGLAMRPIFEARRQAYVAATVDGAPRVVARWIARKTAETRLREPGFELPPSW